MAPLILADTAPGEARVALVHNGRLADFALWRPGAPDGVGDIHIGRAAARVPGLGGVFVALHDAQGFLPDTAGGKGVTEGDGIRVRVTRAAMAGKGPRLVLEARHPGPLALLQRGPDPIARFRARHPDASITTDDPALAAAIPGHVTIAPPFDDALLADIEAIGDPEVALPGGARASIHPTPALVAIDVDAGPAIARARDKRGGHRALNRALLPDLARQIRLRNLSGAIVVDLAGLSPRDRAALGPAFADALASDPLAPRFLGFTALGLAEILRPRIHPPLHELRAGPHAAGLAALRHIAAARPTGPAALRAAPPVIEALQRDPIALPDLARRLGRPLMLRSDPALPALAWRMETP